MSPEPQHTGTGRFKVGDNPDPEGRNKLTPIPVGVLAPAANILQEKEEEE